MMIAFVPLFFFASMYAQISLGESASEAGLYLLIFFAGFATASQWGGRILDAAGARPAVVLGCAVAAVGFYLWAQLADRPLGSATSGTHRHGRSRDGLVLGPANTDALNRVADTATARRPGSPRPSATSAPASASPCSARS